jgi:hypothetical protein
MFRGEKELPQRENLFIIGRKSRPLYFGEDPSHLSQNARMLSETPKLFEQLVKDFCSSPMAQKFGYPSAKKIERMRMSLPGCRAVRFTQLLLYALHYQNYKPSLSGWRDYL